MKQFFDTIPNEIKNSRRFFLVAEDKRPLQKDWSNPAIQKPYTEINGLAGFDTVGHGVADDYLFLDFDHVLNADGDFVNNSVEDLFGELVLTFKNLYVEKSISGTGLHAFLKPTAGKFETVSNGKLGVYHFDNNTDKNSPKLELFYGSGGRYCLLTGKLFDCDEGAELNIPAGVEVDEYLTKLLADIQAQLQERGNTTPARNAENIFTGENFTAPTDDPAEYTRDLIQACLNAINPAALNDTDWLAVMSACKNLGVAESIVDRFNQRDLERYNAAENKTRWDSLKDSSFDIKVLSGKAQDSGFSVKDFKRQWYKDNPQFQQARFKSEENKLAADEKAFEDEKTAAIEYLKNLSTFDNQTVTASETLKAAAFAKIYDTQVFELFKDEVKNYNATHKQGVTDLNDLKAAVKKFVAEIKYRAFTLKKRGSVLAAEKKTTAFVSQDDFLKELNIPQEYSLTADGVFKLKGDTYIQICYAPIVVADKYFNLDTKKISLRLAYKPAKKWRFSPITTPSVAFNHRQIVSLADDGLPINSINGYGVVEFLAAFDAVNAEIIPVTCIVDNCGWRKIDGNLEFIDPRRNITITGESGKSLPVIPAETSFTRALNDVGSLDKWRNVYSRVKEYPVARAIVAAAVAPPLLEILRERNFVFYIWTNTASGKTTALKFAASAVGNSDEIVKVLNATQNGVAGVAAGYDDYLLALDEKEEADDNLRANFKATIYRIANGVSKLRLNKDCSIREQKTWRNIAVITGETEILDDSATGGAYTRLLSVAAPSPVLPPDICKEIYDTIDTNYGLVLPLVIEQIFYWGFENLREMFNDIVDELKKKKTSILFEHCRYIAVLALADFILNVALGVAEDTAYKDAVTTTFELFKYIPTKAQITDSARARDLVLGYIAQNQKNFLGANGIAEKEVFRFEGIVNEDGRYITVKAVKKACKEEKVSYDKLRKDLIADGFFVAEKGEITPVKTIGAFKDRCFKINPKYY